MDSGYIASLKDYSSLLEKLFKNIEKKLNEYQTAELSSQNILKGEIAKDLSTIQNNISLMKNNGYFNEKVEQYKLHPHRRINLKLVGEGIKQKLIKMNEENGIYDQEKMYSSPQSRNGTHLFKNRYSIEISNNNDNSHYSIMTDIECPQKGKNTNIVISPNLKLTENRTELFKKRDKSNSCENLIKIKIPNYKNKRTKQKDYFKTIKSIRNFKQIFNIIK